MAASSFEIHSPAPAIVIALSLLASVLVQPLGSAGAGCSADEQGPAVRVSVSGLRDRTGLLRIELYPANDTDFLADDDLLLAAGKPFRRIDVPTPEARAPEICVRAPSPGPYAVLVMHDRNGDRKFSILSDGVGFPNNPKLRLSKPKASQVTVSVGPGVSHYSLTMNYWSGLSFRPSRKP